MPYLPLNTRHPCGIGSIMFHVEQNVSNEIIGIMLQADLHSRGLADKLQTNHMTVARKLRDLVDKTLSFSGLKGRTRSII